MTRVHVTHSGRGGGKTFWRGPAANTGWRHRSPQLGHEMLNVGIGVEYYSGTDHKRIPASTSGQFARGRTNIGTGGSGAKTVSVSHGLGFTPQVVIPQVTHATADTTVFTVFARDITSTTFLLVVRRVDSMSASWTTNLNVDWIVFP